MRDDWRVSLDGAWDFQIGSDDPSDATPQEEWRSAIVPRPWQAQFEDLRNTSGVAWYRRHLVIDQASFCAVKESTARTMVRVGRSEALTGPYVDRDGVPLTKGGGTLILSAYGQWKGPGHDDMLIEDGVYWMVYHAYDAKQIGVPKLRIESISWDASGRPSLPSQTQEP